MCFLVGTQGKNMPREVVASREGSISPLPWSQGNMGNSVLKECALESDSEILPPLWAECWLERHWRFGSDSALEKASVLHTDEGGLSRCQPLYKPPLPSNKFGWERHPLCLHFVRPGQLLSLISHALLAQ